MINKTALKKACYMAILFSNSCVGAVYLSMELSIDFNIIVGFIYFIISIICIYLAYYNN